jgi:hypothetical protein
MTGLTGNDLLALFGAAATLVGGCWALIKIVVYQFEARLNERFDALEKSRAENRAALAEKIKSIVDRQTINEGALSGMLRTMPIDYTRREDTIRGEVQTNAKLDALNGRMDKWINRFNREDK